MGRYGLRTAFLLMASAATCVVIACSDFSSVPAAEAADAAPDIDVIESGSTTPDPVDAARDAQTSAYRAAILADGPLAYWRMGISGPVSLVPDETDGGNALLLQGSGHGRGYAGAIRDDDDTAIRFDGLTSYAVATDARAFDFPGASPFTIECWALREPLAEPLDATDGDAGVLPAVFQHLIGNLDSAGNGYTLYAVPKGSVGNSLRTVVEHDAPGKAPRSATGPLAPASTWSYYAVVFDGALISLFIDATLVASNATDGTLGKRNTPFVVGRSPTGNTGHWPGAIDEIAIYARALPLAQLLAHRDLGKKL